MVLCVSLFHCSSYPITHKSSLLQLAKCTKSHAGFVVLRTERDVPQATQDDEVAALDSTVEWLKLLTDIIRQRLCGLTADETAGCRAACTFEEHKRQVQSVKAQLSCLGQAWASMLHQSLTGAPHVPRSSRCWSSGMREANCDSNGTPRSLSHCIAKQLCSAACSLTTAPLAITVSACVRHTLAPFMLF